MCAYVAKGLLVDALVGAHEVLRREGVEHALCGGIAANLYRDELRTTTDVDLYIACAPAELVALTRSFEEAGWLAHPSWRGGDLIRLERDDLPRVDLLVASTSYEREAVARAVEGEFGEVVVPVLAPEDLVVFKLVAGRARDYEAVAAIINSNPGALDVGFIERTLADLGMQELWPRAIEEAEREAEGLG